MTKKQENPIWIYPEKKAEWQKKIIQEFKIHPVTAQILVSRGFTSLKMIHQFLYGKLPSLYAPELFPDMGKAIHRILLALQRKEKILIYGDNDVDGMTGAALLMEFFQYIHADAIVYLSNRSDLRHSMIEDALQFAIQHKCSLLITVDCGITASQEMEKAVAHSIDVIITDHHEPTSILPNCIATLNPKLLKNTYPNRELTGVGVAFKLAHALLNTLLERKLLPKPSIDLKDFLDLVALGTISDMGALNEENRILVRYGLKTLQNTKRIGLIKLCTLCGLNILNLSTNEVSSKITPRLNSLGRIANPNKGVEFLLCKEEKQAEKLVRELDFYNLERQKIEKKAFEDIEKLFQRNPQLLKEKAILLQSDKWHPGIVPILAARIAKQYHRPAVVIALEKDLGKGSARTIAEFPLLPLLKKNRSLFENFGGHDFAAGLIIKKENIHLFKKKFLEEVNAFLKEQDLLTKLYLDANARFEDLTFDFMESLSLLEPFGQENPSPVLYTDAYQTWPPKVIGKNHLKLFLQQNDRMLEAIGFNLGERKSQLRKKGAKLRLAFTPYVSSFMNKHSIQLQIKDFKVLSR